MITVKDKSETSFIVKKSKFMGLASRIESEAQAQCELEERRKKYYDATHNCYAYLLENGTMRFSDDGEPQGTAGLPMLEVLKKSGLCNVLLICTRYFGGTLLGAGGLSRAYAKSASDTLDAAQKAEILPCSVFKCTFPYGIWSKAEQLLKDSGHLLCSVEYADDVTAEICVDVKEEESLLKQIGNISFGKTIPIPLGIRLIEHNI
jgi:uncharacterized YigZ family protein